MAQVYVSIGSNVDRVIHVTAALDALGSHFGDLEVSSVFESEAIGFSGEPFYNLVAGFQTGEDLPELVSRLKRIEDDNGRNRGAPKFSARTLDIDVLLYDDRVGEFAGIRLPREEITENAFVLRPLAELAPNLLHPECRRTYAQLWREYRTDQKLWPVDFRWKGALISKADQAS